MKWKAYSEYRPSDVEWLGKVPDAWEMRRLKNIARFAYGDPLAAEDRVVGNCSVYGSNGIVGQHDRPNTKGPCLIVGRKGSFGKIAYSEKPCFAIDTTYFVDDRYTCNNMRWLYYCLHCLRLDAFSKDSAVPGLSREDAYENVLPFCPPDEQRAIVAFLNRETTRIDALIAKKQPQIELLQEKRAAIISHAVTNGLDANAPMKDSGIEWLEEVPNHWEVKPLGKVFKIINGSTPKSGELNYWDGSIVWATPDDLGNLSSDTLWTTRRTITEEGYGSCGTSLAPAGSLVLSTRAPIGHVAIAGVPLCTNQGCRALVPRNAEFERFLYYQLVTARPELESWGQGSTFKELSRDRLAAIHLAIPPFDEQRAIADFLDRETARIDALIAKINLSITALREYRNAIISAAVTGKIDVREGAA